MIVDCRSLPYNQKFEADVCIVGGGLAGVTLAKEFIGQKFSVCLVESGGLKADRGTQSLAWGENIGHPYFPLDTAYARFLGGSPNRWTIKIHENQFGARMRPLDPIDFEQRDWVPYSGWPFEKSHLDDFYLRAQELCKIEAVTYDLDDWEDPGKAPRFNFKGDLVRTVIFKFGSRNTFLRDHLQHVFQAGNIKTLLYANATGLETEENVRTVHTLQVACLDGKKFSVAARIFILAAGGIETPRLLLLSNKVQKAGLGNTYDLIGRFFMEHLHFLTGVLIPATQGANGATALYDHIHHIKGVPIIGKLALEEQALRREKLVNFVAELVPRVIQYSLLGGMIFPGLVSKSVDSYKVIRSAIRDKAFPENFGRHLKNVCMGMDDIFENAFRKLKRKSWETFNRKKIRAFRLASMSEQVPNPASRITLSEKRDKLGLNCVKLDWRLDAIDIRSVVRSQEILKDAVERSGLGKLYIEFNEQTRPEKVTGGWHQMGTTRMHTDAKKGVVDENCRVHGVSNLYISGPSVFPTGGYANPALTTVALAVRLADHVKSMFL